jgi:6-phospho-3-hexuloisomerase
MTKVNNFDARALGTRAGQDLEAVFSKFEPSQLEILSQELLAAKRIVCYGVGREGLMMAAIAMRLMHAGFKSYVVGEMVTPPVGPGDIFFTSAGPGHFPIIETLLKVAQEAGGRTVAVTDPAGPGGANARGRGNLFARPDHGGRVGRLERLNHGHPLRGGLVVVGRFASPAPSRTD